MATYIIQETVNFTETRRHATDAEICELFPHQVIFSASSTQVAADSTSSIRIQLQLTSAPLNDDTRRNIAKSTVINVIADGETIPVQLDENGYGELPGVFAAPGDYHFTTDGVIYSDGIIIKAV